VSDLTDMLADPDFKTGDYTVTRTAEPTIDTEGVATAGATSTFTTGSASLQPLEGVDLKNLPQGIHASDARKLYTTATLRVVPVPDTVAIGSEAYTVVGFAPWTGFGSTHQIAILARRPTP